MAEPDGNAEILADESFGIAVGGPALRRSRGRLVWRVAIAVVVLAALIVVGRRYFGELDRLKSAGPGIIALMAALYIVGRAPSAEITRASLISLGHRVGHAETFFVLMVQYYVNTLIPRAGIGALAGYFKLRRGVPVADLSATQLLTGTLTQFATLGVAALACQGVLAARGVAKWDPLLAVMFAGVAVACIAPLVVPLPKLAALESEAGRMGFLARFLGRLSDACRRLGRDRRLLARAFALHAVVLLLRAWRVQLSFRAVGVRVGYWPAFVASAAADVMFLVSVTPGGLGFREGGLVYAARVMGTTGDVALAAAVLDRLAVTACNVVLGQIGIWRYVGRWPRV